MSHKLWVDLRRLYEPDPNDSYWKFEATDLHTTWSYYDSCEVHHVSTTAGVDVFMFVEKEYPLRAVTLTAMLTSRLRVHEDTEKVRALIQKIQNQCSRVMQEFRKRR